MKSHDLARMGAARVSLGEHKGEKCIYKNNASTVETNFYQFAAEQLDGVNTPKLLSVDNNDLRIEFIPNRITLDELNTNEGTFEQLAHIHQSKYSPSFTVKTHAWSLEATESALTILQFPQITQDSIFSIQSHSATLFEHGGLISGDSNDGNWGVRNNGELVLFDWERFGFGSPAIDLAPLVRGLGTIDDYQRIADKYNNYNSTFSAELLQQHLIIAKLWIVVEVTNILTSRNKPDVTTYIDWFKANVPTWLTTVEKRYSLD